jgi:uncharacterized damage-inducible protein DinB
VSSEEGGDGVSVNPYAYALAGSDPAKVIAETPERLAALLEGLTPEQIEASPALGKWSVREVVSHLADCEIAFGFRLRQALAGESMIQPFDQDAWARAYGAYSAELALATFAALRDWNLAFIGELSESDKLLPVNHPERGTMTLWAIVETMAGHDLHHLQKLAGSDSSGS